MKNKLTDLNDHLFAQMERLGDEDLEGDALAKEVERSGAMVKVADKIIENAGLVLDGAKLAAEYGKGVAPNPLLGIEDKNDET